MTTQGTDPPVGATPPYATGDRVELRFRMLTDGTRPWDPSTVNWCRWNWQGLDFWDLDCTVDESVGLPDRHVVLYINPDGTTDVVRRMAAVTVTPTTAAAGALLTVQGERFPTDQTVTIELYQGSEGGTAIETREPTVRPDGTFTDRDVKIPNDAQAGPYRVVTTVPGYTIDGATTPITVTVKA